MEMNGGYQDITFGNGEQVGMDQFNTGTRGVRTASVRVTLDIILISILIRRVIVSSI